MASAIDYLSELTDTLQRTNFDSINLLITLISQFVDSDKKIFVCGNGGSASTASHMVVDLSKTSTKNLQVVCLNDNIPSLTAIANDINYDEVFSYQLQKLGKKGDLLIVISGSGNSKNILRVLERAKQLNISSFGLLGFSGGKAKEMCDNFLVVESDNYGVIEDTHLIVNHMIAQAFKL